MTDQEKLWKGEFGDEYALRNRLTDDFVRPRMFFWENTIKNLYHIGRGLPGNILEIGAGAGVNLHCINAIYKNQIGGPAAANFKLYATEVNEETAEAMQVNVPDVTLIQPKDLGEYEGKMDFVFTAGVLIHVHPKHRINLMRQIYNASKKYIMCIEYFAPETRAIDYRGEKDALWLDDYGSLYLDNFPLRVINYGFAWKKVTGLDNVTYWIFEKTNG